MLKCVLKHTIDKITYEKFDKDLPVDSKCAI